MAQHYKCYVVEIVSSTIYFHFSFPQINFSQVRNFLAIMEDIPMKLGHVDLLQNEPFTCRSIFVNAPLVREMNMPLLLYYNLRNLNPVHHFTTSAHSQVDFPKVGRGKYHLLQLMHKFPILQKVCVLQKIVLVLLVWDNKNNQSVIC